MSHWDDLRDERRAYEDSCARRANIVCTVVVCSIVASFVWVCVVIATQ